jgi:hypothetical protein
MEYTRVVHENEFTAYACTFQLSAAAASLACAT